MSKRLECNKCFTYLGEMEKGKIKKGAVILCDKCIDYYKISDSLAKFKKGGSGSSGSSGSSPSDNFSDFGDIFKDILGGQ